MKRLPWLAFSSALVIAGPLVAQDTPKPAPIEIPDVVKGITARELGGHMKFLASDLMRGRDTASPEIRLAAEYLASRLSAAGAEPAGDSDQDRTTYFQRFPLEVTTPLQEGTSLSLEIDRDGSKRVDPAPARLRRHLHARRASRPGEIDAPVVFAGYGRVNQAEKIDDYEGLDVKNRFVLVLAGQPPAKPKEGVKEAARRPSSRSRPRVDRRSDGRQAANLAKLEPAAKRGRLRGDRRPAHVGGRCQAGPRAGRRSPLARIRPALR